MKSTIVTLPAHFACALINGDSSGLDSDDLRQFALICEYLDAEGLNVVSVAGDDETGEPQEPRFTWHYFLYAPGSDVSGGSVLDYVALYN